MKKLTPFIIFLFAAGAIVGSGLFLGYKNLNTPAVNVADIAFGAPIQRLERTLIPEADSLYDLGTTTQAWREGWFDRICFTADTCRTTWPTSGGGGSGSVGTSTADTATQVTFFTTTGATPALIGGDSGMTYNAAADRLTVINASTSVLTVSGTASTTNLVVSGLNAASCDVKASTSGVLSCGTDATAAGGAAAIATSTGETAGNLAYWTSTNATPALLGKVATSSITLNSPITSAGTPGFVVGGSGWTLDVDDIGAADLASADFGDFTCNGTTCAVDANSVALTTDTTGNYVESITGTANQITVTNGSGAEDLDSTLALASHVIFPSSYQAAFGSTTNATSTGLNVTGTYIDFDNLTSALIITGATGILAEYTGADCTNQVIVDLSVLGAPSCTTITSAYVDSSIITTASILDNLAQTNLADPGSDMLVFWDDSDTHFDFISTLAGLSISGNTLTVTDVTCTDCLNATEIEDIFLLNTGDVGTGNYDFGGATFFEIPNGTGPTADDPGEIAHDTSDNMVIVDDFVVARATTRMWGVTVASTSAYMIGGTNLAVPDQADGYTMTSITCRTVSGTSVAIVITDGSNATESITCTSAGATDDGSITNAAVTAGEDMYIDFGTVTGAVDTVSISVFGQWTRE